MCLDKTPMSFIQKYLEELQKELIKEYCALSAIQKLWLGFCLMGILLINSVCWAKFERMSFGKYSQAALSWMFRHAKFPWEKLLKVSVMMILRRFNLGEGVLAVDDKDLNRSKNAKKLFKLHKIKDKKTGGYVLGQNIVVIYLVTKKISIPVGFKFYAPNPDMKQWREEIKICKENKIAKKYWPNRPQDSLDYPKKYELALELLGDFKKYYPEMTIRVVLADGLYGHLPFIEGIEALWPEIQVITKMRRNQTVRYGNKKYNCEQYSNSYKGWEHSILIRGGEEKKVTASGGRLFVPSHKQKQMVIAMKYEEEKEYRYLLASNLSWNMTSIMELFSIRWLIEVFFEDWSCYNGFCSLAKQCGVDGSLRSLILSLLFDHCFLFHEEQKVLIENGRSLATFGTLLEKTRAQALLEFIRQILESKSPKKRLQELADNLDEVFPLASSKKHLNSVDMRFMNKKVA